MNSAPWCSATRSTRWLRTGPWCGTVTALLIRLQKRVPKRRQRLQGWPTSVETLLVLAHQLIDRLRKEGVEMTFLHEQVTQGLLIRVARLESQSVAAVPSKSKDQQPLFTIEELIECGRAAHGKRWR
jgi:hypothetical protein